MEEWIKVSGKTVDDAILEASIQLGTNRDNIEYDVVERETRGFLGIGARPAVIRARKKVEEVDIISEVFSAEEKTVKEEKQPKKQPEKKKAPKEKPVKEEEKKQENPLPAAKKEQPKKQEAPKAQKNNKQENKVQEKSVKKERPARSEEVRVPADPAEATRRAEEFLKNMFAAMNMEVEIKTVFDNDSLNIELAGKDMGVLIGKRGQTLDSIQYLTSLVVNKGKASYVRVKVDTEDYRERRKATLENLGKNIAMKVKKTGRSVYLEPMNPYERRIIHSALQNDPYVTTHSEGEEPNRKVVVTLKKKEHAMKQE